MPSDVFFTSSPAEYPKLEGLYVTERQPPGFIRSVDLSDVGFAGKCVRGPLTVQKITSPARFVEVYGERNYGLLSGGTLVGEVWKALLNKPFGTIWVRRVAAAAAIVGTKTLSDVVPTAIVRVDATSPGAWAADVTVAVEAATDANAAHFNLRVNYLGKEVVYKNLSCNSTDDNLAATIGDDFGNVIKATKLAPGRPLNAVATVLTLGADGVLAATDYVAGIDDLAHIDGPSVCLVPESLEDTVTVGAQATLNAEIVTLSPTVADRVFLTWSGIWSATDVQDETALTTQITTASDRIVWCYNPPYTLDPKIGLQIQTAPHVWMASILSQNDVDGHPGAHETRAQLAGITKLTHPSFSRQQLIGLKAAGISTIETLDGGFQFRSGVTTSLTPGLEEITRRRSCDMLQLSAAGRLRTFVKGKNTPTIRAQMGGELTAYSEQLKDTERVVQAFSVDQVSVNTDAQRALGQEFILWRVRLIGHILELVLQTQIGTGTVIQVGP